MHAVALAQNGRVDCDVDHENAENACAPIYTDIYAETLELWLILATGVCLFFSERHRHCVPLASNCNKQ